MSTTRFRLGALLIAGLCGGIGCNGDEPGACRSDNDCAARGNQSACVVGSCTAPSCPAGSVYIPGGSFERGCSEMSPACARDAQPAHQVTLSRGFCLAPTELTVAEYRRCLASGACPMPSAQDPLRCSADGATWTESPGAAETLPMNCLLPAEAEAACRSLAPGGRLPTEAEWERAARSSDGRAFPWGAGMPIGCDQGVNFSGSGCTLRPWPAVLVEGDGPTQRKRTGAMEISAQAIVDLAGNVSEWVADVYAQDGYGPCALGCTDPAGPPPTGASTLRVRRGGSFRSPVAELLGYAREFHREAGPRSDLIGARCVLQTGATAR